jgi:succinylglutamate desuccinylase
MNKEEIIEIKGKEDGPTSIILAGTHGDETGGIKALEKMIPLLKIEKGRVLAGYGNPKAIERNVRFTEANLNRMYKPDEFFSKKEKESYEYGRAQFLKKYLDQADALLDLHASFVPQSRAFIICEANAHDIVKHFPFDLVVSGFDAGQPGGTDYYMNKIGGIGICVECGYLGNALSAQTAEQTILDFLAARGHIKADLKTCRQSAINMTNLYFTKTDDFKLAKEFEDFEKVSKGQLIGTDGGEEVRSSKDGIILFARDMNVKGEESFFLGEKV